jgi:hypothetical protein
VEQLLPQMGQKNEGTRKHLEYHQKFTEQVSTTPKEIR